MKIRMEYEGFFDFLRITRRRSTRKGWLIAIVFVGVLLGLLAGAIVSVPVSLVSGIVGMAFPFWGNLLLQLVGVVGGGVVAFKVGNRLLPKRE